MNQGKLRGLVLNRKVGEIISINRGELKIEVIQIKGQYVRLVFEAARDIKIDREEKEPGVIK